MESLLGEVDSAVILACVILALALFFMFFFIVLAVVTAKRFTEAFEKITLGMPEDEVIKLIGNNPIQTSQGDDNTKVSVWKKTWGIGMTGHTMSGTVVFKDGKVSHIIKPNDKTTKGPNS